MKAGLYYGNNCFSIVAIIYDRGFDKEEEKKPVETQEIPAKAEEKQKPSSLVDDSASQFRGFGA